MPYKSIVFIISFLCLITACKNDDPEPDLPPITQIGANTLGFKVNGRNWVPKRSFNQALCISDYEGYSTSDYFFGISAVRTTKPGHSSGFGFSLNFMDQPKDYFDYYGEIPFSMSYDDYNTDWEKPGKLLITKIDTINKIVSGQFEFSATHPDTGESIQITDGRFDVTFGYCR